MFGADHVQPFEQRYRRRQQRFDADRALPRERLAFEALRLAFPIPADVEMQPHVRVRIHIFDAAPFLGAVDRQPQLFDELALERFCLLYTSPSPRDLSTSRMPSSA